MSITQSVFGTMPDGKTVHLYTMEQDGISVSVTEYGARITDIQFEGTHVVCGFNTLEGYLADKDYHGSIVGRYANRIAKAQFTLHEKVYQLANNETGRAHLHGGNVGYDSRVWDKVSAVTEDDADLLTLKLRSPDGEEGYPGNLRILVTYMLKDNALSISYSAVCDADTIINLTNHAYFSLGGVGSTVLDQTLTLNCQHFVPVDEKLIPYGTLSHVEDTPFDFRKPKTIGKDIRALNTQILIGGGYDHCFVRNGGAELKNPEWIATLSSPKSGIVMDVFTTEGGIQMYTGNFMTAPNPFYGTIPQRANEAVALECNRIPDSPNQKEFPSPVLKAGDEYSQTTIYAFKKK